MIDDGPRRQLCALIQRFGPSLHDDPQRCRALLLDLCRNGRREIFCLISAQEHQVPAALLAAAPGTPMVGLLRRLARQLVMDLGLAEDMAWWAVESWALAMRKIPAPLPSPTTAPSQPSPRPKPPAQAAAPKPLVPKGPAVPAKRGSTPGRSATPAPPAPPGDTSRHPTAPLSDSPAPRPGAQGPGAAAGPPAPRKPQPEPGVHCPNCNQPIDGHPVGSVRCPVCQWEFAVDRQGRITAGYPIAVNCPQCGEPFHVPGAGTATCPHCICSFKVDAYGTIIGY